MYSSNDRFSGNRPGALRTSPAVAGRPDLGPVSAALRGEHLGESVRAILAGGLKSQLPGDVFVPRRTNGRGLSAAGAWTPAAAPRTRATASICFLPPSFASTEAWISPGVFGMCRLSMSLTSSSSEDSLRRAADKQTTVGTGPKGAPRSKKKVNYVECGTSACDMIIKY